MNVVQDACQGCGRCNIVGIYVFLILVSPSDIPGEEGDCANVKLSWRLVSFGCGGWFCGRINARLYLTLSIRVLLSQLRRLDDNFGIVSLV